MQEDTTPVYFQDLELNNIVTPVKVGKFVRLLKEYDYDPEQTTFSEQGFTHGFDIGYRGPIDRKS